MEDDQRTYQEESGGVRVRELVLPYAEPRRSVCAMWRTEQLSCVDRNWRETGGASSMEI